MVAVQFACPYCSGMFLVDSSTSGPRVACPHCRGLLAVPANDGLPLAAVRAAASPAQLPLVAAVQPGPIVVREPVKMVGCGIDAVELRTLSPEEKAHRKMMKNLFLWGFGLLLIGITLALLLTLGPL